MHPLIRFWISIQMHLSRNCCGVGASVPSSFCFNMCFQSTRKALLFSEEPFGPTHRFHSFCGRVKSSKNQFASFPASSNGRNSSYSVQVFQRKWVILFWKIQSVAISSQLQVRFSKSSIGCWYDFCCFHLNMCQLYMSVGKYDRCCFFFHLILFHGSHALNRMHLHSRFLQDFPRAGSPLVYPIAAPNYAIELE